MRFLTRRSTSIFGVVAIAEIASSLALQARPDPEARCNQLLAHYTRYGTSRGEDTDGNRNVVRIGAEIDCREGRYEEGIIAMKELMKRKNWTVPPPS